MPQPAIAMPVCPVGTKHEAMPRDRQTPEALAAYHKAEIEKWTPIIKASGVKAE